LRDFLDITVYFALFEEENFSMKEECCSQWRMKAEKSEMKQMGRRFLVVFEK